MYQTVTLSSVPSATPVRVAEERATVHLIPLTILLFPRLLIVSFLDLRYGDYSQGELFPTIEQLYGLLLTFHTLLFKQESLSQKELLSGAKGL